MMLALLLLWHGDDPRMALMYFWSAVLIALTPMIVFGTIAALLVRGYRRRHREGREAGDG